MTRLTCDKCRKPTAKKHLATVWKQTARQTHWSPAEYDTQDWCVACRDDADAEASRDDDDYDRAVAHGWAD